MPTCSVRVEACCVDAPLRRRFSATTFAAEVLLALRVSLLFLRNRMRNFLCSTPPGLLEHTQRPAPWIRYGDYSIGHDCHNVSLFRTRSGLDPSSQPWMRAMQLVLSTTPCSWYNTRSEDSVRAHLLYLLGRTNLLNMNWRPGWFVNGRLVKSICTKENVTNGLRPRDHLLRFLDWMGLLKSDRKPAFFAIIGLLESFFTEDVTDEIERQSLPALPPRPGILVAAECKTCLVYGSRDV